MSKVIKKITKPISKGLDRFIPNEYINRNKKPVFIR